MSEHVEWIDAATAWSEVTLRHEEWSDAYDQTIDRGKVGLSLGNDDVVMIEGTPEQIRGLLQRALDKLDGVTAACEECADGDHVDTNKAGRCKCCGDLVLHALELEDGRWGVYTVAAEDPEDGELMAGPFASLAEAERYIEIEQVED